VIEPHTLRTKEAAEYAGVSEWKLRQLVHAGEITFLPGKYWRFACFATALGRIFGHRPEVTWVCDTVTHAVRSLSARFLPGRSVAAGARRAYGAI
jgi:excisionase family DNA binding protein